LRSSVPIFQRLNMPARSQGKASNATADSRPVSKTETALSLLSGRYQKISCPVIKDGGKPLPSLLNLSLERFNMVMTLSVAGSNKRILVAAVVFFSLLIVLLVPDGCLSYGPLSSTSIPGPAAP
jgi:hypothetical protein